MKSKIKSYVYVDFIKLIQVTEM